MSIGDHGHEAVDGQGRRWLISDNAPTRLPDSNWAGVTETRTIIPPDPPGTIRCPYCGGSGNNGDGMYSVSTRTLPNGSREVNTTSRPPSNCRECDGTGKMRAVKMERANDEK